MKSKDSTVTSTASAVTPFWWMIDLPPFPNSQTLSINPHYFNHIMKKITAILLFGALSANLYAQEGSGLEISGSVDTYYKYDFSGYKAEDGSSNIGTYFGNEQ